MTILILLLSCSSADIQEYLKGLGESSMRCSACELVAKRVDDAIDSTFLKGWKTWTTETRAKKLKSKLSKTCPAFESMQIALMGDIGVRTFIDFQEAMQKGGTLTNLQMGATEGEKVKTVCNMLASEQSTALVQVLETFIKQKRRRLADVQWRTAVCETLLGACPKAEDDEDAEDEDEDEREL